MKKLLLTLSLFTFAFVGKSQDDLYQQLKTAITQSHPEINMDNKLIAYNIWSVADAESREANKSFEKAYLVWEKAKLKGGSKGIVVVAINKDNLSSTASIVFSKDGMVKTLSFKYDDLRGLNEGTPANLVFDSNGQQIYKNLKAQVVYSSINSLITR